jgi:hypothetical protein
MEFSLNEGAHPTDAAHMTDAYTKTVCEPCAFGMRVRELHTLGTRVRWLFAIKNEKKALFF